MIVKTVVKGYGLEFGDYTTHLEKFKVKLVHLSGLVLVEMKQHIALVCLSDMKMNAQFVEDLIYTGPIPNYLDRPCLCNLLNNPLCPVIYCSP